MSTFTCVLTIETHHLNKIIRVIRDDVLLSLANNQSIKLWNSANGKFIGKLGITLQNERHDNNQSKINLSHVTILI